VSCPPYVEGAKRAGSLPALLMLEAQGTLFPCACCVEVAPPACSAGDTLPPGRLLGPEKGGGGCAYRSRTRPATLYSGRLAASASVGLPHINYHA